MFCCPDDRNAKIFNWKTLEGVVSSSVLLHHTNLSTDIGFVILASAVPRTRPTVPKTLSGGEAAAVPSPRARHEVTDALDHSFYFSSMLLPTSYIPDFYT